MTIAEKIANEDLEKHITFDFKQLGFSTLKKILDTYGVVVGRGAFPVRELKKVRDLIYQQIFPRMKLGRDFREDLTKFETFPKELKMKTLVSLLEGVTNLLEVDRDHILRNIVEQSGLMPMVEEYVGKGKIHSLTQYYYSRTVDPLEEGYKLAFHQDGTFLRGLGEPDRFMICWIPLVVIDEYTPGLELVAKPFSAILDTDRSQYHSVAMADQKNIEERYKEYLIQPKIRMGDFILFNPFIPHRTYITSNMTDIRTSIDFRFYCGDPQDLEKPKEQSTKADNY